MPALSAALASWARSGMQALPLAAFFLFLEAAAGGVIALFLVHLRGEVSRGYTLFTGWCLWICAAIAVWLCSSFPPGRVPPPNPQAGLWLGVEQVLSVALLALLALYLLALSLGRERVTGMLGPVVPLAGLGALWSAALVEPGPQLAGLGAPLAVLAGALALGSALAGLSLGHWYLVTPALSVRPLIRLTFLCLGAVLAQGLLLPLLLLGPGADPPRLPGLLADYGLFLGMRVVFGLAVPVGTALLAWRTARIRSLDSATGLLYLLAALILAGEIVARTLFFLAGVAT